MIQYVIVKTIVWLVVGGQPIVGCWSLPRWVLIVVVHVVAIVHCCILRRMVSLMVTRLDIIHCALVCATLSIYNV